MLVPDRHIIETPEQTRLEFPLAGIGSRFLALAIDMLIEAVISVVVILIAIIIGVSGALNIFRQGPVWGLALLALIAFAVYFGYFAAFEIIWSGQTPGKRIIGIRVIKETGRPLAPTETLARNLLRIVDQLPAFYALGVVVAMLNPLNKRIGDFVAGSIVVRESSFRDTKPVWYPASTTATSVQLGAQNLSAADLSLIDTFLHRRNDLDPGVRAHMADEIVTRFRSKLSPAARDLSDEAILESLAYERRSAAGYTS